MNYVMWVVCVFFFLFKQKTAYEMRISDWSSDVCSSDLVSRIRRYAGGCDLAVAADLADPHAHDVRALPAAGPGGTPGCVFADDRALDRSPDQIGRASCRERVCQYV